MSGERQTDDRMGRDDKVAGERQTDPQVLWYCWWAEAWLKYPCRHRSCESRR